MRAALFCRIATGVPGLYNPAAAKAEQVAGGGEEEGSRVGEDIYGCGAHPRLVLPQPVAGGEHARLPAEGACAFELRSGALFVRAGLPLCGKGHVREQAQRAGGIFAGELLPARDAAGPLLRQPPRADEGALLRTGCIRLQLFACSSSAPEALRPLCPMLRHQLVSHSLRTAAPVARPQPALGALSVKGVEGPAQVLAGSTV